MAKALQCCPPRRAGVGTPSIQVRSPPKTASMLPAPKGGSRTDEAGVDLGHLLASMLPAPKGGSRSTTERIRRAKNALQCCPPRRAGVGTAGVDTTLFDPFRLQCCPPRRAGVGWDGRVVGVDEQLVLQCCPPRRAGVGRRCGCRSRQWTGFNAARPEGRESGGAGQAHRRGARASMLPAPKGGSRPSTPRGPRTRRPTLQCCPPRRAGVGERHPGTRTPVLAASMLPAPKGGSRPPLPPGTHDLIVTLQCCPPRRAGVGSRCCR